MIDEIPRAVPHAVPHATPAVRTISVHCPAPGCAREISLPIRTSWPPRPYQTRDEESGLPQLVVTLTADPEPLHAHLRQDHAAAAADELPLLGAELPGR